MAQLKDLIVNGPSRFIGDVYATTFTGDLNGNANTATSANTAAALTGKTLVTASDVTTSNWPTYASNHIPTMSFMAYWNGAYSGTSSNLTYCAQGTIIGSNNIGNQSVKYATTSGTCSGNAATATKATQDGNGNVITSTYLPLAGGVMTGTLSSNGGYYIGNPKGGNYHTKETTTTGCITITLPEDIGNTMVSMWVDVFHYVTQKSFSVHISGYTYVGSGSNTWINNPSVMVYGAEHRVRLGYDGTHFVIYIGETTTQWSYPQVNVRDVMLGYSPALAKWRNAWSIGFSTEVQNVTYDTTTYAYTTKNLTASTIGGLGTLSNNISGNAATAGSATSADYANEIACKGILDSQEKIDNFISPNRLEYALFKTTDTNNVDFASNDGMILSIPWTSTTYGAQIAFDDSTSGTVKVRGKSSTWGNWYTLLHSGNYTTYCTPTNIGAAPSSHTHTKSEITDFAHTHTKSQITDFPTSLPASDVKAWAKADTKPSYAGTEVTLSGYSKNNSYTPIASGDSVQAAIAKLEGAINGLEDLLASI